MTKRGVLIVLDSTMFLSFIVLMSWRLSGVNAHEWIGLSLVVLMLLHLVVHWGWVEGTVTRLSRPGHRGGLIALLLNTALFISMGTALVSGVVISKVVFPNELQPGDYLHWHSLHDGASTFTLFILGLHIALNWDRIRSSVGRLFDATHRGGARLLPSGTLIRRFALVLGVSLVLIVGVFAAARAVPTHAQVLMTFPDGHTELTSPPDDIARLQPGNTAPDPQRGTPRLILSFAMLSVAAVVGRRVLKLRLL
jgi:cytochrome b561